ncbi:MAG: DUF3078 domain-containing protein, partial [Lutibacter sp.]|nr:DUF3078 domain-containing protein [Lutibacter sp.]
MNLRIFLILGLFSSQFAAAEVVIDSIDNHLVSRTFWTKKNNVSLFLTQHSFSNWSTGGNNSIAGIVKVHMQRNYKDDYIIWNNELKAHYGLNKEEAREVRKTEDRFEVNSSYGYRNDENSNWYYSVKFNFKTQFTNGYQYPNTDKPVSRLFAPAYLFLGAGAEYNSKENKARYYLSPLTNKTTLVLSESLANQGAFGVDPAIYDEAGTLLEQGKKSNIEFGILVTGTHETALMTNIQMTNKLILYTDYLHDFGNIDINWELNFDLTVNEYIT